MSEQIKFYKSEDNLYIVDVDMPYKDTFRLTFIDDDMPSFDIMSGGFYIYNETESACYSYMDYNIIYASHETCRSLATNQVILTNFSDNVYQEQTTEYNKSDIVENDIQDDNDEKPPLVIEDIEQEYDEVLSFNDVKEMKLQELSEICNQLIEQGVEIDGKTYSYTIEDQVNIKNLFDISTTTQQNVPWHSNGNLCKMYTPVEIATLYIAEQKNLIYHTTYFNFMKNYIDSIPDEDGAIDKVNAIYYGEPMPQEYLDIFNNLINEASEFIIAAQKIVAPMVEE